MKAKDPFKKIGKVFIRHWRKWTLLAICGMIIYLGFLFYEYIYQPIYQPGEIVSVQREIAKQVYQKVMDAYFQKQENINQVFNKNYLDIFK
jgi:hypothetical protein